MRKLTAATLGWLALVVAAPAAPAEDLRSYARTCDAAVGVGVPDFNCDDPSFTTVPTTRLTPPEAQYPEGDCDRPNRLREQCDKDSRFKVLIDSPSAYVVAHCRKMGHGPGGYGDIAVIQHNRKTGATCFYQSDIRFKPATPLNGDVKAPGRGSAAWPWKTPEATAGDRCVACHDNGPLIRSPYLAQLRGTPNALPDANNERTRLAFNSTEQPYNFVGDDFAGWKVFDVHVADSPCHGCHRLGVSNRSGKTLGTAIDFAKRATSPGEAHKHPPSADSPMWMPLDTTVFNPAHLEAALKIKACAERLPDDPAAGLLPSSPDCTLTEYGRWIPPPAPPKGCQLGPHGAACGVANIVCDAPLPEEFKVRDLTNHRFLDVWFSYAPWGRIDVEYSGEGEVELAVCATGPGGERCDKSFRATLPPSVCHPGSVPPAFRCPTGQVRCRGACKPIRECKFLQ